MRFRETIFVPLLLFLVFGLILLTALIPEERLELNSNPYLAVAVLQLAVFGIPALLYSRIRGKNLTPHLRLHLAPLSQILYLLYGTIFLICGTALVGMGLYALFPVPYAASSANQYTVAAADSRFFDGVYMVVAFALLPAVTEEFMFRGIVVGEYEKNGPAIAAFMGALAFAMSHFSLVRFPVYLFSGLVLAAVLFTTRSLFAAMLLHTLYNTSVLFLEPYVMRLMDKKNVSVTLFLLILGFLTILSALLMSFEASRIYRHYYESGMMPEHGDGEKKSAISRIGAVFFSPAFLALVVFFVTVALIRR